MQIEYAFICWLHKLKIKLPHSSQTFSMSVIGREVLKVSEANIAQIMLLGVFIICYRRIHIIMHNYFNVTVIWCHGIYAKSNGFA